VLQSGSGNRAVCGRDCDFACLLLLEMVNFNRNVKVLGYYLSDDERELKRRWSSENYERMVDFKRQVRRSKLFQRGKTLEALTEAQALKFASVCTVDEMEVDCKSCHSVVKRSRPRRRPASEITVPVSDEGPALEVQLPSKPAILEDTECDKWSNTFVGLVFEAIQVAITRLKKLDKKFAKNPEDWKDLHSMVLLQNLFVPDFSSE